MIIFDARQIISYKDFDIFLKRESEYFKKERDCLFEKYNFFAKIEWDGNIKKYQAFRNEYRDLIQKIIII